MSFWKQLRIPSSFPDDWYGELTNQSGHHALIGIPFALALLPFFPVVWVPVAVALIYAVIWEIIAQHGADWKDSLTDTACVMAGASLLCGPFFFLPPALFWPVWVTQALCFAGWAVLLAIGVVRRT